MELCAAGNLRNLRTVPCVVTTGKCVMRTKKLQRSPLRLLNKIDVRPHTFSQGAERQRHRHLIRNIENDVLAAI